MTFNVLFACHCNSEYLTKNPVVREWRRTKDYIGLNVRDPHPTIRWESTYPVADMHWMDPNPACPKDSQQFHAWSSLSPNHYDIVWSMYCSVYEHLTAPTRNTPITPHVVSFYHDVWSVLKEYGIFVLQVDTQFGVSLAEQEARSQELLTHLSDPWDVSLVPIHSLPFVVDMPGKEKYALVFVKRGSRDDRGEKEGRYVGNTGSRRKTRTRRVR